MCPFNEKHKMPKQFRWETEQYDKFSEIKTNSGEEMQDEVRQEMEEAKPGQQQSSILADEIQDQQLLVPDKKNLAAASVQLHSIAGATRALAS